MLHSISLHNIHIIMKQMMHSQLLSIDHYLQRHETLFILTSFVVIPAISILLLFAIVSILMLPIACILELL